jgi:coenzyme F420-reducing hydrogenase beta subunit
MIIAAQNKNDKDRLESSSGAIFPLIAKKIIKEGGVVYGAAFNDKFEVEHIRVNNLDSLPRLYGSKYVFSNCRVYPNVRDDLEEGRIVLFTGTPCQVGGLVSFLKKDYQNLYLIDNICHGAPSAKLWEQYLRERTEGKAISSITFRDKSKGWQHYRFVIKYKDGSEYNIDHDADLYMRGFIDNITLRDACFHCKFKGVESRQSDITLGDLWGAWVFLPEMFDDKGTSLLFVNSDKGKQLLGGIREDIVISEVARQKAIEWNACAVRPSKPGVFRDRFLKDYKKSDKLIPVLKKYAMPGFGLKAYRKIYNMTHKD